MLVYAHRQDPNAVTLAPGERHWDIFRRLCQEVNAKGNLIADAYLAALAIETGAEWITTDRDYACFSGLRWRHPLTRPAFPSRKALATQSAKPLAALLARIIHDGLWRNRAVARRDRRAEPRGRKAYLKQYVDRPSGEPACLGAAQPRPGLSQRRIRDCSRTVHE